MREMARVVAAIESCDSFDDVKAAVREYAVPQGYDRFALYSAGPSRDGTVNQIFWVEGQWYAEEEHVEFAEYIRRCPATRNVHNTDAPYFWTKTRSDGVERYRIVAHPLGEGLHGFQVPLFGARGLKGAMLFGGNRIESDITTRLALVAIATASFASAERLSLIEKKQTRGTLSPREQEVLQWVAAGSRQSEIAATLGLSERTVENHLRRIRRGLGTLTTSEAVRAAIRLGIIKA